MGEYQLSYTGGAIDELLKKVEQIESALCNSQKLTGTATPGDNYSSAELGVCFLMGNILRIYLAAERSSKFTIGDIANETVAHVSLTHNGKITGYAAVTFGGGPAGGNNSYWIANPTVSSTTFEFDVKIAAAQATTASLSMYGIIPVKIDISKY